MGLANSVFVEVNISDSKYTYCVNMYLTCCLKHIPIYKQINLNLAIEKLIHIRRHVTKQMLLSLLQTQP